MPRILVVLSTLWSVWLLAEGSAAAAPTLRASIEWRGACQDRAALGSEIRARGAELDEVRADNSAVQLDVWVRSTATEQLRAEIQLTAGASRASRRVDARDCRALRRAVAWVLSIFAEERAAAEAVAEQRNRPSTAAFPAPAPAPPAPRESKSSARSDVLLSASKPPRAHFRTVPRGLGRVPCVRPAPRFRLGSELQAGFGLVRSASLGPALLGTYQACGRWLPSISLGASRLMSIGYELDARSMQLERSSGQIGAWLALTTTPVLSAGLELELGRLRATGNAGTDGAGSSSNAPWLALVPGLRLDVPLLERALALTIGLHTGYAPLRYVLRYSSGQELARPGHFELRVGAGLAGGF